VRKDNKDIGIHSEGYQNEKQIFDLCKKNS